MSDTADILSYDEIAKITGYTQPCKQLEDLRDQGFVRARRNRYGRIILERAHYDAVCRGEYAQAAQVKKTGVITSFLKTA